MKRLSRAIAVTASLSLALVLAACGASSEPVDTEEGLKAYLKKTMAKYGGGFSVDTNVSPFEDSFSGDRAKCRDILNRISWYWRLLDESGIMPLNAQVVKRISGFGARTDCKYNMAPPVPSILKSFGKPLHGDEYYFTLVKQEIVSFTELRPKGRTDGFGKRCALYATFILKNIEWTGFARASKDSIPGYIQDKLNKPEMKGSFCGRLNEDGTVTIEDIDTL